MLGMFEGILDSTLERKDWNWTLAERLVYLESVCSLIRRTAKLVKVQRESWERKPGKRKPQQCGFLNDQRKAYHQASLFSLKFPYFYCCAQQKQFKWKIASLFLCPRIKNIKKRKRFISPGILDLFTVLSRQCAFSC